MFSCFYDAVWDGITLLKIIECRLKTEWTENAMNIQNYFLNEGNTEWDMHDIQWWRSLRITHWCTILALAWLSVYFEFYHFLWSLFGLKVIASFFLFFPENFLYSHDVGGSNNFQGISVDLGLSYFLGGWDLSVSR